MLDGSQLLLVGVVAAVGILRMIVSDHWVPIASIARRARSSAALLGRCSKRFAPYLT
jgi:hypothetical protein